MIRQFFLSFQSVLFLIGLLLSQLALATTGISLQGRILRADGTPVNGKSVQFVVQIRSPGNENCLLYQESQTLDMSSSNGLFSLTVGAGSRAASTVDGGYSLERIFSNVGVIDLSTTSPGACSIGTNYIPASSDHRKIIYSFNEGTGWQTVPSMSINWVPLALNAKNVGGFGSDQLLRVMDGSGNPSTAPSLTSSQATELMKLIMGTTTQYVTPGSAVFTAAPQYSGTPSSGSDLVNKTYVDSIVSSSLPDVGTAGTYYKVVTDSKGRVISGASSLLEADIPQLTSAGKVDGGAINAGTIGGTAGINSSGNLVTSGTVSANVSSANQLRVYNSGKYVEFTAPSLSSNISFKLPAADGSSGQVLRTDGAGNLSWASPSTGSVTSVGASAPLSSSGGSTPTLSISQASSTTDGYLSSTDWSTFNNKLGTATSFSGDVTGAYNVTSVVKIQGTPVATSALTAGNLLRYNGSAWVNANLTASDIPNLDASKITSGTLSVSRGGTGSAAALTNNKVMVSSGGAIVEGNGFGSTKAANTFVTRDASGNFAAGTGTFDSLKLNGSTSGTLTLTVPASFANFSLNLPSVDGSSGQFLMTDGSGNLTWGTSAAPGDATYSAKGIVQFNTDAATSGISLSSGVATVNFGTGANQIVKLDGSSKLPAVDGSQLTNLSAAQITAGTLPISRGGTGASTKTAAFDALSPNSTKGDITVYNGTNNVSLPVGSNGQVLTADSAQATGVKWASASSGTVTSVTAGTGLNGGTITSVGTLSVNVGTGANQIVQLDGSSKLPAVDGSQLTNLSFSQISSGTLPVSKGGTGASSFSANQLVGTDGTGTVLQSVTCSQNQVVSFDASGKYGCYNLSSIAGGTYFANGGNTFGADATLGTNDNYSLSLKTNNSNRLTIDTSGNVGIGTVSPSGTLDVEGGTASGGVSGKSITFNAQNGGSGNMDGGHINLNPGKRSGTGNDGKVIVGGPVQQSMALHGPGSFLELNSGIGTTGVANGLLVDAYVSGTTAATTFNGVLVTTPTPGSGSLSNFAGYSIVDSTARSGFTRGVQATVSSGANRYNIYADGTADNYFAGQIGIGVASPQSPLDVKGAIRLTGATSGYTGFQPAANAGSTIWTLPTVDGGSGQFLMTDGSGNLTWGTSAAPGDASYSTKGIFKADTDAATSGLAFSSSGVLKVNAGTGANQLVQLDGSSRLPAVDGSALTNLNANNIASGTLPISRGGTGQTTKTAAFDALSPNSTKGDITVFNGTNNVSLPVGSNGQVLTADSAQATGVKWASASSGTVTSVTAGTGLNGGTITSVGTLSVNVGTGANQIVQLDGSSKLPAVDGSQLTNLSFSQISSGTLPVSKGGTGASSLNANQLVGTNGTGTALQSVTCSQNQIISFDASGNYGCYSLGSIAGGTYFANGGNTFGANSTLGTNDNFTLGLKTNNTTRMLIDGTGNVGIGTTSPGAKLHVSGGNVVIDNTSLYSLYDNSGTSTVGAYLSMTSGNNLQLLNGTSAGNMQFSVNNNNGGIIFYNGASSGTERMRIANNGYVGIGTPSPQSPLDVKGAIRLTGATSGYAGFQPAANAGSTIWTLPIVDGSTGQFLMTDGAGNLSWATSAAPGNASYAAKGIVQFNTDAATSGISVSSGVATVNFGTGANQLVQLDGSSRLPAVDGSALTNLNANNISSGTLPISRGGTGASTKTAAFDALSPNSTKGDITVYNGTNNVSLPVGSNGQVLTADSAQATGVKWASASSGTVTSVTAGTGLNGGTITSVGTLSVNVGTGANQIVQLDGSSMLPAVDGSQLTNLSFTQISSGTLPVSKGGTGASTFSANQLVGTNGTGTALQSVTCSQNQVVSFDASGKYGCYNLSSIAGGTYFANGGNTFGANATLGTNDNFTLGFKTNNSTRVMIDTNGNVGIGTTSISAGLHVNRDTIFLADSTNNKAYFYADGTGNVGIGSSLSPTARLQVSNASGVTTNATGLLVSHTATANTASITKTAADIQSTGAWNGAGALNIGLNVNVSGGTTNYAALFNGGNVGIGTTSPGAPLDVKGEIRMSGATSGYAGLKSPATGPSVTWTLPTADGSAGQFLKTDGAGNLSWAAASVPNAFVNGGNSFGGTATLGTNDSNSLSFETNNSTQMTFDASGNVGIGTSPIASGMAIWKDRIYIADSTGNTAYLYGTGGKVIIGDSSTPSAKFQTVDPGARATSETGVLMQNLTTSSTASITKTGVEIQSTGTWNGGGADNIGLKVTVSGGTNNYAALFNGGNVGIGTTTPSALLDVNGTLKVANGGETCSVAANGGMIRYSGTSLQFCNGSAWTTLGTSSGTVTNVQVALPAEFTVSGGPVTSSGTITGAWASQAIGNANKVFATPDSAAGTPGFRTLVATDIPSLDAAKIGSGVLPIARGGTNNGSLSVGAGGVVYTDGTKMASTASGTAGQALLSNALGAPTWGNLAVPAGGTGATTLTSNGVLIGNGTSAITATAAGSANQVLRVPAGGGTPAFGSIDLSQSAAVTGTLPVSNGGTGNSSLAFVTLTDGTPVTWTVSGIVNNAVLTLVGNRTLAFSGLANGMTGTLIVKQDATGGRTLALPAQCTNKVIGGGSGTITLSTSPNAIDILTFVYDGTNCYWTYGKNYN